MRPTTVVLAFLITLGSSVTVTAGEPTGRELRVALGMGAMVASIHETSGLDEVAGGLAIGLAVGYDWSRSGRLYADISAAGGEGEHETSAVSLLSINYRYTLEYERWRPYGFVGGGWLHWRYGEYRFNGPGFRLGAGIEFADRYEIQVFGVTGVGVRDSDGYSISGFGTLVNVRLM